MRINIIFGSASDKHVYEPLCDRLRSIDGLNVYFDVCSAHREPERLRAIIHEKPCELFVAGAGIAAHLPGVIASQTLTPVIGVPVSGVLKGFDALLSILQMPKGIPVLTAGIERVESVVQFIEWYDKNRMRPPVLNVVASPGYEPFVTKLKEPLEKIDWKFVGDGPDADGDSSPLDIWLVDLAKPEAHPAIAAHESKSGSAGGKGGGPAIACALTSARQFDGDLRLLGELTGTGALWVGVNNISNVQLSLLQLWPVGPRERAALEELKGGGKKGAIA